MQNIYLINGTIYTGITVIRNGAVIIKDGIIDNVVNQERFHKMQIPKDSVVFDLQGAIVAPGFIDTHIHGFRGSGTDDRSVDAILEMSKSLAEYGVTGFCPTIYPQADDDFMKTIDVCVKAMGKELGAKILGLHLEGPFISHDKLGVQRPEYVRDVDIDLMKKFYEAAQGKISIMTVAPELKNMRDLALYGTKKGIVMSAGHSNATYENMLEGMHAGILHSTHFFNAMRRLHHRDPGVVGAIMIHSHISCEIIPDGFHVHPAIINLLRKEKPLHNIVMVTDALRPTEQKEGLLIANDEEVYIDEGVFKRKKDSVIAGSSLTMINGAKNLVSWGVPIHDAIRMGSTNPSRILNLHKKIGSLLPGLEANLMVFDKNYTVLMTIIDGKITNNKL
jgi:N-acetylglucosamine-6-phosphate deacetylase